MSGDGGTRAWTSWGEAPVSVDEGEVARSARARRRRRRLAIGLCVLVGLGAVSAAGAMALAEPPPPDPTRVTASSYYSEASPLGTPPPPPAGADGYAFTGRQGDGTGDPIAHDPCQPIHYVVRPDNAPQGGDALIRAAVAEVSRATGLVFVHDGSTSEAPTARRELFEVNSAVTRPVLIAWSDEDESPDLAGETVGYTNSVYLEGDWWTPEVPGTRRYVSGQIVIDHPDSAALLLGRSGRKQARALIMHELGHLVGLDHVDDPSQLMHPALGTTNLSFQDGDLRGLHRLGSGRCFL